MFPRSRFLYRSASVRRPARAGLAVLLAPLVLSGLAAAPLAALDRLESRLPDAFSASEGRLPIAGQGISGVYAVQNATVVEPFNLSASPLPDGKGWALRILTRTMEISASTANGLLINESRYRMSLPSMLAKWKYDTRTSRTEHSGKDWVSTGALVKDGKVSSQFSVAMGAAPLDSDFLGFQLAVLAGRGAGSFNADFLIKNRGMKVNADFLLARADEAKVKAMLAESGSFAGDLSKILVPGCLVYTIKLTGFIGALFPSNIYAAFTDESEPAFLAYWNTDPKDREGLWITP